MIKPVCKDHPRAVPFKIANVGVNHAWWMCPTCHLTLGMAGKPDKNTTRVSHVTTFAIIASPKKGRESAEVRRLRERIETRRPVLKLVRAILQWMPKKLQHGWLLDLEEAIARERVVRES